MDAFAQLQGALGDRAGACVVLLAAGALYFLFEQLSDRKSVV